MTEAPSTPRPSRVIARAARVGLPLAILAVVMGVFLGEQLHIDHELSIVLPAAARPGDTIPARALVFDRLETPDGPRLTTATVQLSLLDPSGAVRARATLVPSVAGGAEGHLAVPAAIAGRLTVEAVAVIDGEAVASARTSLAVQEDPPRVVPIGRSATPLQQLALEPIEGDAPPARLDVRVVGGACVPEEPCEVLVHVGEPAASVTLETPPSLTLAPTDAPQAETSGLTSLQVVVHGPEAHATLVASRSGVEVGRRRVRLPVALATPGLELRERVTAPDVPPALAVRILGDRPGVIVEAHQDGRWHRTGSFAPGAGVRPVPFELPSGVWQLEAHTDPFSAERAAVRVVVVGTPERDPIEALGGAPPGPVTLRLAWAAAAHEERTHPLPEPVSGRADDLARLEGRQRTLRIAAVVALIVGLLVATVLFLLRGVEAAHEAQAVMDATGDPELTSARHRRRTLLSALLVVGALLLAFLGAAILIVARAHLFG